MVHLIPTAFSGKGLLFSSFRGGNGISDYTVQGYRLCKSLIFLIGKMDSYYLFCRVVVDLALRQKTQKVPNKWQTLLHVDKPRSKPKFSRLKRASAFPSPRRLLWARPDGPPPLPLFLGTQAQETALLALNGNAITFCTPSWEARRPLPLELLFLSACKDNLDVVFFYRTLLSFTLVTSQRWQK